MLAEVQSISLLYPVPHIILLATVVGGAGSALMMVSSSPFLTENSTKDERSHLFSVNMAALMHYFFARREHDLTAAVAD